MKLDYVVVVFDEQWDGWRWRAHGTRGSFSGYIDSSEGEYTRAADARRGAERYVAREWPDYELGPWEDA